MTPAAGAARGNEAALRFALLGLAWLGLCGAHSSRPLTSSCQTQKEKKMKEAASARRCTTFDMPLAMQRYMAARAGGADGAGGQTDCLAAGTMCQIKRKDPISCNEIELQLHVVAVAL